MRLRARRDLSGARPPSTSSSMGMSWMEYIAARGYDVYLLDLRGYGKSTRPKEMSEEAEAQPADRARRHRGEGHRHGGRLRARAPQHPARQPDRLVVGHDADGDLHDAEHRQGRAAGALRAGRGSAPRRRWCRPAPARSPPIARCRATQALGRWLTGVPEDKKAALIPAGWFDAWADATWATDPEGAKTNPPVLRAPNGVMQDSAEFWSAPARPTTTRPRSRCRRCWCSPNGTATRRPTWRRRCSRCW